jgi:3-oxoacid CoA-transferase
MSKARETRNFRGKNYVMEESIFGDVALVKVNKADRLGNCTFRKAQNNFNEVMAKNAKLTIVEADEIVEVGELAPEAIHIQGIYVDVVVQSTEPKKIEKLTFAKDAKDTTVKEGEAILLKFPIFLSHFIRYALHDNDELPTNVQDCSDTVQH